MKIAEHGQSQTSYQILASGSREALNRNEGNLWNSQKVSSSQSVNVEYAGKSLKYGDRCYWKVRVWDESGVASGWSNPSSWTVGPLDRPDWQASWIGTDDTFTATPEPSREDCTIWDPWLRKTYRLSASPRRAEFHVASVGYHEVYVNGVKVSDGVLVPSVANLKKRVRYLTYDIAEYLQAGDNVIAIWLGTSWSIYPGYQTDDKPHGPIVLAQGTVVCDDDSEVAIQTDASWKTHPSPNKLLGSWEFRNFGGEHYDANRELPNWNTAECDLAAWKDAVVYQPDLLVTAEMVEPNRVVESVPARTIEQTAGGDYRVDMGRNFVGWLDLDLTGTPGETVEILSSERKEETVTHRIRSEYVIGPSGKGTFRHRFNYHSGRWLTIRNASRRPMLQEVRGSMIRTDFDRTGHFACSDELINQIYETTLWTFENLCLGGYVVDCPQRERMGYGGDAHATTLTGLRNYGLHAFYAKWNQDWHDVQFADGYLPHTAPTYWGGGGPGWSGFCTMLPWEYYCQYGDLRILEHSYPVIERWLGFLEAHSANDMLVRWPGRKGCAADRWSFLGDWLWPGAKGTNSHTPESLFFNNCYWIYNLDTAASIADAIGRPEDAERYRSRADAVRTAVHRKFYSPSSQSYADGQQTSLAMALAVDLPPSELREQVWETLEDDILRRKQGHIHAGITGGAFLFKLLMEHGRYDLLYTMASKQDYPGWGNMLRQGATTIWESWEDREVGSGDSKLHSSYLYVGAWPVHGLAGIKPDPSGGGFQRFLVEPARLAAERFDWMQAAYESPYGQIVVAMQRSAGAFEYRIEVPANTTALVSLPCSSLKFLTIDGALVESVDGVIHPTLIDGLVRFEAKPGRYLASVSQNDVANRGR